MSVPVFEYADVTLSQTGSGGGAGDGLTLADGDVEADGETEAEAIGGATAMTTAELRAFDVSTPAVPAFSLDVLIWWNDTAASVCPTVLLSVVFESALSV